MGCICCIRCGDLIDLDYCVEGAWCDDQIPGLTKTGHDWVCEGCLTDEEREKADNWMNGATNEPK